MTKKKLPVPAGADALAIYTEPEAQGYEPQTIMVKIAHGQEQFVLAGMPAVRRLEGVILASKKCRIFYPRMGNKEETDALLDMSSNRPFCVSVDSITGELVDIDWDTAPEVARLLKEKVSEGALDCRACPFSKWESVQFLGQTGNRKACDEIRRLLYWKPGIAVPVILSVPPSSIRNWDNYCSALTVAGAVGGGQAVHHNRFVTEVGLEHKGSGDRQWSVLSFAVTGPVTDDMVEELLQEVSFQDKDQPLVKALINLFHGREISLEDIPDNGSIEKKEDDF